MTRFGKLDLPVMQSNIPASAKVTYAALRLFEHTKTGQCNPSLSKLSEATGLLRQNISRAIRQLVSAGFIAVERGPKNGNIYSFTVINMITECNQYDNSTVIKSENLSSSIDKTYNKTFDKTPLPPTTDKVITLVPSDRSQHADVAQAFLTAWNEALPRTVPGADQLQDQNSIITMLTEHGKTLDELHAILQHIADQGKAKYWPRPSNLLRHTGGGSGPYVYAHIETEMESNVKPNKHNAAAAIDEWFAKKHLEYGTGGDEADKPDAGWITAGLAVDR